jgi:hypothetical protein
MHDPCTKSLTTVLAATNGPLLAGSAEALRCSYRHVTARASSAAAVAATTARELI